MSEPIDVSDLTDEAVLKIMIERERESIIAQRQMKADSTAALQETQDYVHRYGTDEG